jgi:SAM-dependent methyltransferase
MKATLIHRDNCRLCGSKKIQLVVKLAPIPLAEKYTTTADAKGADAFPIDLYMCLDCGHVQVLDVIDSDTLWDDYTYHSGQTKGIVEHFEQVADKLVSKVRPAAGSLVIDVGSNDGSLLRQFKQRGHKVLGIDPAKDIARKATESGIETIPELMSVALARKVREKHGPASVITAFNVFAHADDMGGMADSIRTMLAPDGVFLFEVQYLMDIIDHMLLGTIFHEHMSHHSLKPMIQFLGRHDMELIDVERVTIQKGSIIGTAQPKGGPRKASPAVAELLALETARKLDRPETVMEFGRKLDKLKSQTAQLVEDWKAKGATVAGYGAARSGPTLIAQLDLGKVIGCIFDDHPQKVGKFSPGDRIPVLPTSELYKRKPDYVIILAWIHAKKIIAGNREYLEEGGHFVVCCPEVQVIGADSTPTNL